MGIDEFKGMIGQLMPKPVNDFEFKYFTIEDLEYNTKIKEKAVKLSRVFNNYSILADGTINDFDASIVLNVQNGEMRIYSIVLWHINLYEKTTKELIPTDTLFTEKIALIIPEGFRDPVFEENFTSFILPGTTERDAVIQVMNNQKVAELNIYTYMWADHITSAYRRSDFEISYIKEGYMIKYEMIDEDDVVNQGITVGIEHNNQLILIQYFGFKETYNEHWVAIDEMMRNIVKL